MTGPVSNPPPSIGATGLFFVAGALFAHGIGLQVAHGIPVPLGGWVLPPVLVVFSMGLLAVVTRTRARLGVPLSDAARRRQRWLLLGAAIGGLVLGAVVAVTRGGA